jgi:hypothetical protein
MWRCLLSTASGYDTRIHKYVVGVLGAPSCGTIRLLGVKLRYFLSSSLARSSTWYLPIAMTGKSRQVLLCAVGSVTPSYYAILQYYLVTYMPHFLLLISSHYLNIRICSK